MERQAEIEIYVKDCSNDRVLAWVESVVGALGQPEEVGADGAMVYPSPIGPVIVNPNIKGGSFGSVWFNTSHSPWIEY